MKISLISDLHLENGYQTLPGGDVLILAGDIAEATSFKSELHQTKPIDYTPGAFRCWDFLKYECAKYNKVYYIVGNHEHYRGKIHKTRSMLTGIVPDNVTLLDNDCEEHDGILFIGATLWTDCNNGDPITKMSLTNSMNDSRMITQYNDKLDVYHKLTPEYTMELHDASKQYIFKIAELNKDKPIVVITHHAPSFASVNEKYKHETAMNGGFASDLSDLILDHPQIKYWCHGHMHDPVDYMIGETRVISNPRGYVGYEDTSKFNPNFTFDI